MAEDAKTKGNTAFSAGRHEEAIEHYTSAIQLNETNAVLWSNRSAAKAAKGDYQAAVDDAKKTVELASEWGKGYSRLGTAHHGLGQLDEAEEAYRQGLRHDPESAQLKAGLEEVTSARAKGGEDVSSGIGSLFSAPDLWAKLATNPNTASYLQQDDFIQMIRDLQANPKKINEYSQDSRLMQVLSVLLESGGGGAKQPQQKQQEGNKPTPQQNPMNTHPSKPKQNAQPQEEMTESKKAKEEGNKLYKEKRFEEAIGKYEEAREMDPEDISILTNIAAVKLEMGSFEEAIGKCDEAIEKGRESRADYKLIAKAMTRKGNAFYKQDNLEEAIRMYQASLTEHRNPETLKRQREAETKLRKRKEEEYRNPELGEEHRNQGNEKFKEHDYPNAIKEYEEALRRNEEDYKALSNRAACYMKLGSWYEAYKDADKCIELAPDFAKGYSRKGAVQYFMKEYHKALETYRQGLRLDDSNAELNEGARAASEMIAKANRGELSEEEMKERQERALNDPEIQQILQDPSMQTVLQQMQSDPQGASSHLKNPGIAEKVEKLVNAGVVRMQ